MRLGRLRWPEWLIAGSGAVLVVALLALTWYRSAHRSLSGWSALSHLRWVFLAAAALALVTGLAQASLRAPAIPVTLTLFATVVGGLTTVLLIYRVLADPPGGRRQAGGFVALGAAVALTYGGLRSLRSDSIPETDAPADIPVVSVPTGTGSGAGATLDS